MKRHFPTAAALTLLAAPALARAAVTFAPSDCINDPNGPSCGINGVLHVLYIIAAILGVVLLIVIALAVHAWRKSKRAELDKL